VGAADSAIHTPSDTLHPIPHPTRYAGHPPHKGEGQRFCVSRLGLHRPLFDPRFIPYSALLEGLSISTC